MYRITPYLLLFAFTVLLQLFLFDNLSISVYFNPLIYIALIVLLPLDTPSILLLAVALVVGLVMDYLTGAAGLYTLSTLPVAIFRPLIVKFVTNHDDAREGGVPSEERLGTTNFMRYLVLVVLLHHTIFFIFESLSWSHLPSTLVRILLSSVISLGFIWIITRLFTAKLPSRL